MSLRYIGSKTRVVNEIIAVLGPHPKMGGYFVDGFCGTGAVSEAAARAGWPIRLNDHLLSAVTMAHARLLSHQDVPFRDLGGYTAALDQLNLTKPFRGFLWREYSPASKERTGVERMYFTNSNAARIDGIRRRIAVWRAEGALSELEERLLIADLLLAANRVANIAGTYGCFLSHWSPQSKRTLALVRRELFPHRLDVQSSTTDVTHIHVTPHDIVYLDPPYTKRQYAAYYHVLETITAGDSPTVTGITGLRPWQAKASDFCYRTRALRSLVQLVENQAACRVLLSYSDEGHVAMEPLTTALSHVGTVSIVPLKVVGRYRPNRAASRAGDDVTEYLLVIDRPPHVMRKAVPA